ncbi:MAG TPA: CdaR family protein [Syntrophomonadaceae bacterium]|nr:CdaR family protein [Syntrophomonadaceae bacterium]
MNQTSRPKERKIGLKVISLILACLLWFYVVNRGPADGGANAVQVDLKHYHLADGLAFSGPEQVSVRVWGNESGKDSIVAYVELDKLGPGTYELPVKVEPVKGAILTTVEPSKVKIELNQLSQHIFTVGYEVSKNPPSGYQVLDLMVVPDKCVIEGQESNVKRVSKVVCLADLSNVTDTTSFKANLVARDSKGIEVQGLTFVPAGVNVYAVVTQKQASKKLPVKVPVGQQPAALYKVGKIEMIPDTVSVLGSETALNDLKEVSTKALDLSGKNASFSQEVDLVLPDGVKAYPAKILVNVEITSTPGKEGR